MNVQPNNRSGAAITALLTTLLAILPLSSRAEVLTETFPDVLPLNGDISSFFEPDGTPRPGVCVQVDTNTMVGPILGLSEAASLGLHESPSSAGATLDNVIHPSGFNQRRVISAYNPDVDGGTIYIGIDLPGGTGTPANTEFDNGTFGGGIVFSRGQVLPFDADGNGEMDFIGRLVDGVTPYSACAVGNGLPDVWSCGNMSESAGAVDNPRGGFYGEEEFYNATVTFGGGQQVRLLFLVDNFTAAGEADLVVMSALPVTGRVSSSTGMSGVPLGFDVEFAISGVNAAVPNDCDRFYQQVVVRSGSNSDGSGQGEDVNELICEYDLPACIEVTKVCEDQAAFGSGILFSGTVTNCGSLTLTNVMVEDEHAGLVLGPITLAPGEGALYNGSYQPDPCVGDVTNTVTASGIACTGEMVSDMASDVCEVVPRNPCLTVSKVCSIPDCETVMFSGFVTNCGDVILTNVLIVDDMAGPVLGPITLNPGEWVPYNGMYVGMKGQTNTDTVVVTGVDECGLTAMASATASCFEPCPEPCVEVLKTVACLEPGDTCGPFGKEATGYKGMADPAFCYSITITNCGEVALTNLVVTDNQLGDLTGMFFDSPLTELPVGGSTNLVFKMAWGATTTNTVTVTGQGNFAGVMVDDFDLAVANVLEASVTCDLIISSPDDQDGNPNDNNLQLPNDLDPHLVTYAVVVCNTGDSDLANVTVDASALAGLGCADPAPFSLAAGECVTNVLCEVMLTCDDRPQMIDVSVQAEVDTSGGQCGYDINGTNITVATMCSGAVNPCPPCIDVIKTVACLLPGDNCGPFSKEATGYKGMADPAFCYSITITNCGTIAITNLTVMDNQFGDLTDMFIDSPLTELPVGGTTNLIFKMAWGLTTTNTVTVMGQGTTAGVTVSDFDLAVANVLEASVTCDLIVSSPDDQDGNPNDNNLQLPNDLDPHLVTYAVVVCNTGDSDLANVTIDASALAGLGCASPAPFSLAAGECVTNVLCEVVLTCEDRPQMIEIGVDAEVDTSGGECGYDLDGNNITVATSCNAMVNPCPPCIDVVKEVACLLPGDNCGPFGKEATGYKGMTDPAFCYSITISNCSTIPLTNVTVIDNQLGDLTSMFIASPTTVLAPGASTRQIFKMAWGTTTTNTVTATGQSTTTGAMVDDFDEAVAHVKEASVSCEVLVQSPDDQDGNPNDNNLTLPEQGVYPVTYTVIVCNTGDSALANVTVDASALAGLGCLNPPPFSLAPGECVTNVICEVRLTCADRPQMIEISVNAEVDTSQGECGYDINGEKVTTQTTCGAMINPCEGEPCLDVIKNADKTLVLPGEPVTYTYTVTNCGSVTLTDINVVDDNGTPGFPDDDFVVGFIDSLDPGQTQDFSNMVMLPVTVCADGTSDATGMLIAQFLPSGDVEVTFIQSVNVNDNTYGANAIGWGGPDKHQFKNLVGSDKAEFEFKNGNGQVVLEFKMDYISASDLYPSGYGTLGVTDGEGKVQTGDASSVLSFSTSLTENLNKEPFLSNVGLYTTDSPALADPVSAEWEYRMIYSMVVDKDAFGPSGFGGVKIVDQHNSPSKKGSFTPVPCVECVTNVVVAESVFGTNVLVAMDDEVVCLDTPCQECDGGVTKLTLQYTGTIVDAHIRVEDGDVLFDGIVQPGETFMFVGTGDGGKMSSEVDLFVNGVKNTDIHTSCSQPIGPGVVKGDFLVVEGYSRDGGKMCELGCSECKGGVTKLTLQYNGGVVDAHIRVDDGDILFDGIVQPGGTFTFSGAGSDGKMGNLEISVNGIESTDVHTSCSQPIGPGAVFGEFTVVSGFSAKGGEICDEDQPPGGCSECKGGVTKLTLQYTGDVADADVEVEAKGGDVVFSGVVQPGESFMFMGADKDGKLGTEITVTVNGGHAVDIHTSCSQPIGPGIAFGNFLVVEAVSKDGGLICEIVRCAEEDKFWKKNPGEWPAPYSTGQAVGSVFNKASSKAKNKTLLEAVDGKAGDGDEKKLLKQAVAALLNAARPDFSYKYTVDEVIMAVNMALMNGKQAQKTLEDLLKEANKETECEPKARPCISVTKLVACLLPNDDCGVFGKTALGYKGINDPGFCYSITVSNCGPVALTDLTVVDDQLGILTSEFFAPNAELLPGDSVTGYVKMAWGVDTINTVIVSGRESKVGGMVVMDQDSATAVVEPASVVCQVIASSPDDLDGNPANGHVQLPEDGQPHPVTFTVIVCNTGGADLANVTIGTSPGLGCAVLPPFDLPAGACYTNVLCHTEVDCASAPLVNEVVVMAEVANTGGCSYDFNGEPIVLGSECQATVDCRPPDPEPGLRLTKVADEATVEPGGIVTYTYTVENTGGVALTDLTIVDDNGTPGFLADDFVVAQNVSLAPGEMKSYDFMVILPIIVCPSGETLPSGMLIVEVLPDGNIKASFIQSADVNDNTYGVNSIGWGGPNKHKFNNLVGSDKAEFEFRNGNGQVVLQFTQDYISESDAFPAGYGSLGVMDGEGKMGVGDAASVLWTTTSLEENLNKEPFLSNVGQYTVDSPALADPNSGLWEYRMIYSVIVDKDAFGSSGYGSVAIIDQHNSPKKRSVDDPQPCGGCVTNVATVTASAGQGVLTANDSAVVCSTQMPPPVSGSCPEKADFWKKNAGAWPAPYQPSQTVGSVFDKAPGSAASKTLLEALNKKAGSGKAKDLLVEAVAALLNASTPGVAYPFTPDDIIMGVNMAFMNGGDASLKALKELLKDANENKDCNEPGKMDDCTTAGRPNVLTLVYNGQSCAEASNSQQEGKTSCNGGDPQDAPTVRIIVTDSPNSPGGGDAVFFDGMVNLNDPFEASTANAGEDKFQSNTYILIYVGQDLVQTVQMHTSCSAPLIRGETFGALTLQDYRIDP